MSSESRRVFTVFGILPEPGGYSLAKFSRSAKSYEEWARDLAPEQAEKFYTTYYFDYGHKSIADLSHVIIALENVSQIAAFDLWNHPLIDGQESSTRYQDYSKRSIFIPPELKNHEFGKQIETRSREVISAYIEFGDAVTGYYKKVKIPPKEMAPEKAERTFRARSFDVSRYLLPLNILTGLGLIMSTRTLEAHISYLRSSPVQEIRDIGEEMKDVAMNRIPFNPAKERLKEVLKGYPELYENAVKALGFDRPMTPTLLRYANPDEYRIKTLSEFERVAADLLPESPERFAERGVQLFLNVNPEVDMISSMLYKVTFLPYGYIKQRVESLPESERERLIDILQKHRRRHDTFPQETGAYPLIYDVCFDIGASRDINRNRRMVKVNQSIGPFLGYDIPKPTQDPDLVESTGWRERFIAEMESSRNLSLRIYKKFPHVAPYALPMAFRRRMLLKMDAWELEYLCNDRTSEEGQFSYREIVYEMWEQYKEHFPASAKHFRVTHPSRGNFFKR